LIPINASKMSLTRHARMAAAGLLLVNFPREEICIRKQLAGALG
jgi:hypothetical protein